MEKRRLNGNLNEVSTQVIHFSRELFALASCDRSVVFQLAVNRKIRLFFHSFACQLIEH